MKSRSSIHAQNGLGSLLKTTSGRLDNGIGSLDRDVGAAQEKESLSKLSRRLAPEEREQTWLSRCCLYLHLFLYEDIALRLLDAWTQSPPPPSVSSTR